MTVGDGRARWGKLASTPDERVWCVTVDSGAIVTRRNGKVAIVGNCLGRTHRPGQLADEVHANIYRFTEEMHGAFETAAARAKYIQETLGSQQKLLYASYGFPVFFKTAAPVVDPEAIEECGCRPGLKCPEHDF